MVCMSLFVFLFVLFCFSALAEEGEIAGSAVYGFRTPKKSNQMAEKGLLMLKFIIGSSNVTYANYLLLSQF